MNSFNLKWFDSFRYIGFKYLLMHETRNIQESTNVSPKTNFFDELKIFDHYHYVIIIALLMFHTYIWKYRTIDYLVIICLMSIDPVPLYVHIYSEFFLNFERNLNIKHGIFRISDCVSGFWLRVWYFTELV